MIVFARVVDAGSFSGAARALRLSRSAVSMAVAALEEELGVALLHRTTRALRITPAGEELLEGCRQLEQVGQAALEEVCASSARPVGVLRITAPAGIVGERLVAPVAAKLVREHGLTVDLDCTDDRQPLVEGGFDAAIRMGTPRASSLVMRRVGRTQDVVVAAPGLAQRARQAPDLGELRWVIHKNLPRRFVLTGPGRRRTTVTMREAVLVNDSTVMVGLLRGEAGLGLLPRFCLPDDVDRGTLEEVFPERYARMLDIFVLFPSRKRVPARVRLLIEAMKEALAERSS
ncbi:MAG: LysR substrate-binding domain-containing protein [Myxococcota bacterium]